MRSLEEPSRDLVRHHHDHGHETRSELADHVVPTLVRRTQTIAERLEVLPGFYSSKWQLHRIRAESRQEEARESGSAGPLNDYFDFSHRRLARSTRSTLSRMQTLFLEVQRVAEATPLAPDERARIGEVTAKLAELSTWADDDIEFLRHAILLVSDVKNALVDLGRALEDNLRTSR